MDVPEASLMLVLGAEKFGLAQLHQIRGRVGRGSKQSSCHLVCSLAVHQERLEVLTRESSGFAVAQADLYHRCATELCNGPEPLMLCLGWLCHPEALMPC